MAYDNDGKLGHTGVYVGDDLETYLAGARASREQNITVVPPLKKVVAIMQGDEFTALGLPIRRFTVPVWRWLTAESC